MEYQNISFTKLGNPVQSNMSEEMHDKVTHMLGKIEQTILEKTNGRFTYLDVMNSNPEKFLQHVKSGKPIITFFDELFIENNMNKSMVSD